MVRVWVFERLRDSSCVQIPPHAVFSLDHFHDVFPVYGPSVLVGVPSEHVVFCNPMGHA